jgi:hypothetical protein
LKPNTIWGSSAIGTFSDIVGSLFHHILVNGKAGEPAAADILKSVLHGSRSNKQFNTEYKSVIEGVSKNPNNMSLLHLCLGPIAASWRKNMNCGKKKQALSILSLALEYKQFNVSEIIRYFSKGFDFEVGSIVKVVCDEDDINEADDAAAVSFGKNFKFARILSFHKADSDSGFQGKVTARVYENMEQLEEDDGENDGANGREGNVMDIDFEDIKSESGAYLTFKRSQKYR